jgi:hypothetical protein
MHEKLLLCETECLINWSVLMQLFTFKDGFVMSKHFFCKELRKDGFDLAEGRYRELKPVLDEVIIAINVNPNIKIGN